MKFLRLLFIFDYGFSQDLEKSELSSLIDLLEIWAREKGESVAADILSDSECGSLTQDDTGFAFKILVRCYLEVARFGVEIEKWSNLDKNCRVHVTFAVGSESSRIFR